MPWRLIGVLVLVTVETVRVTHAGVEVACHRAAGAQAPGLIDPHYFADRTVKTACRSSHSLYGELRC